MIEERDEFLISRLTDGDLSADELAHVNMLLATSAEARAMAGEYRQLSGLLHLGNETPAMDFSSFRQSVMAGIDEQETVVATRSRSFWTQTLTNYRQVGLAACLLLACGVAWVIYDQSPVQQGPPPVSTASVDVKSAPETAGTFAASGPTAEVAAGPSSAEVSIGPSPSVAKLPAEQLYLNDLRPSRVAIDPESVPARSDDGRAPF